MTAMTTTQLAAAAPSATAPRQLQPPPIRGGGCCCSRRPPSTAFRGRSRRRERETSRGAATAAAAAWSAEQSGLLGLGPDGAEALEEVTDVEVHEDEEEDWDEELESFPAVDWDRAGGSAVTATVADGLSGSSSKHDDDGWRRSDSPSEGDEVEELGIPLTRVPGHVAIIMDGNSRWAAREGVSAAEGYRRGAEALESAVRCCLDWRIERLTVFAFSADNWRRDPSEVAALFSVMATIARAKTGSLADAGVSVRFIGDQTAMPPPLRGAIRRLEDTTNCGPVAPRLKMVVALGYSAKADIAAAARRLAERVERGELSASDIDAGILQAELSTWSAFRSSPPQPSPSTSIIPSLVPTSSLAELSLRPRPLSERSLMAASWNSCSPSDDHNDDDHHLHHADDCADSIHGNDNGTNGRRARRVGTGVMADVDLMIRTSGETRLSDFMLWEMAYAELHFCPNLWPDFGPQEFRKAVMEYASKDRRFGSR